MGLTILTVLILRSMNNHCKSYLRSD